MRELSPSPFSCQCGTVSVTEVQPHILHCYSKSFFGSFASNHSRGLLHASVPAWLSAERSVSVAPLGDAQLNVGCQALSRPRISLFLVVARCSAVMTHLAESFVNIVATKKYSKHTPFHCFFRYSQHIFNVLCQWTRFAFLYHCFQHDGIQEAIVRFFFDFQQIEVIGDAKEYAPSGSLSQMPPVDFGALSLYAHLSVTFDSF